MKTKVVGQTDFENETKDLVEPTKKAALKWLLLGP